MLLLLKENQMHRLEVAMGAGQKWGAGGTISEWAHLGRGCQWG